MRGTRSKFSIGMRLAACIFCFSQGVQSADFPVATRDDVLSLTARIQATQFLTHATFGPTEVEVDALATRMREIGTVAAASEWIDKQTNAALTPPSLCLPLEEQMVTTDASTWSITSGGVPDSRNTVSALKFRKYAWFHNVITGQDQLRQKTAWALSQIFAVGETVPGAGGEELDGTVIGVQPKSRFFGLSNYYDVFVTDAFSKYRHILSKVTYHPVMGEWLSSRGNRRAQNGLYPDENFAREVMQLFTIGLYLLNDDGQQLTDAQGTIPTYASDDILEYAQVFTGFGFGNGTYDPTNTALHPYSSYSGTASAAPIANQKFQVPMRMAAREHDRSSKELLNGLMIPNPNGDDVQHTEATANADIDAALEGLVSHQSCPPFVVHRLIQRLVKSNPSRAYVGRIVSVFKGSGPADRGDLKNVIKAILLDPEAWQPIRVQYQRAPVARFIVTTMGTEDSRLQEPILNYTRFIRFFKSTAQYQKATAGSFADPILINSEFRLASRDAEFEQTPFESPSVFNFYTADYKPVGQIADYVPSPRIPNGDVVAPEFQIVNAISSNRTLNFYLNIVGEGNMIEEVQRINARKITSQDSTTTVLESTRTVVTFNFVSERNLVLATDGIDRLLERLDLLLCGGTLSNQYKARLRTALLAEIVTAGGVGNVSTAEALNIAKGAILAIVTSPSYAVTE